MRCSRISVQSGDAAFEALIVDNRTTHDTRRVAERHVVRDRRISIAITRRRA
jgi:hypothetical protein